MGSKSTKVAKDPIPDPIVTPPKPAFEVHTPKSAPSILVNNPPLFSPSEIRANPTPVRPRIHPIENQRQNRPAFPEYRSQILPPRPVSWNQKSEYIPIVGPRSTVVNEGQWQYQLAFPEYRSQIRPPRPVSKPQKSEYIPIVGPRSTVVSYKPLDFDDAEYRKIYKLVSKKDNFKIECIEKIENPFLEAAYELKRIQKESSYDVSEEPYLFHGTKENFVDDICENNFDWRKCQQHKYGKGVSFSPNSTYASNYSDRHVYQKVMLVAKVLIGNVCEGNELMVLPDPGCDTSEKPGGVVVVKFDDNEFYPAYKITYHLVNENVGRAAPHPHRRFRRR